MKPMRKLHWITTVLVLLGTVASESVQLLLTPDNFESLTKNKNVFVFFYDPHCGHCKKLFPVWEQLSQDYANHDLVLIGKMNCRENREHETFCSSDMELYGLPGLKYGEASYRGAFLQSYNNAKTYKDLKQFVESKLAQKPFCSPGNIEACDEATQILLNKFWSLEKSELEELIDQSHAAIDNHIREFKSEFDIMQQVYNDRERFHQAMTSSMMENIKLLKSARATKR